MVLVLALSLIAAVISGIAYALQSKKVAVFSAVISCCPAIFSIFLIAQMNIHELNDISIFHFIKISQFLKIGEYSIFIGLRCDTLSILWTFAITTLCAFSCIYAIGYMKSCGRFLMYNNLFSASMIFFVTSNNWLQMYIGWELITLASYLLINYYHALKDDYKNVAFKIFTLHKLGDVFFLIGILLIFTHYGTFEFTKFYPINIYGISSSYLIFGVMLLSIVIKSAQLGFMHWLKDAMIAPTPASAFLHAATIVSAGVFLFIRLSAVIEINDATRLFLAMYFLITAIIGGFAACREYDIKKILAWSTCSKTSIMFIACCFSNYIAAVIYFIIHAFIKCALFFCAGNISNALSNERDIRKMGGLMEALPKTYGLTLISSLCFLGVIPTMVGHNDIIHIEHGVLFHIGLYLTEILSWICIIRLVRYVFHGGTHVDEKASGYMNENNQIIIWSTAGLVLVNIVIRGYVYVITQGILTHGTILAYIINLMGLISCVSLFIYFDMERFFAPTMREIKRTFDASLVSIKLLRVKSIIDDVVFTKMYLSMLILSKRIKALISSDNVCLITGCSFILLVIFEIIGGTEWLLTIF